MNLYYVLAIFATQQVSIQNTTYFMLFKIEYFDWLKGQTFITCTHLDLITIAKSKIGVK